MEQWKDVLGYEGLYQVSNKGQVKRLRGNDSMGRYRPERMLKPSRSQKNGKGYWQVNLSKDSKVENKRIHVAVAESFLDIDTSKGVGFKDGNTDNITPENLVELGGAPGNRDHQVDMDKVKAVAQQLVKPNVQKKEIFETLDTTKEFVDKVDRGVGPYYIDGYAYPLRAKAAKTRDAKLIADRKEGMTYKELGRKYGMHLSTARKIVKRNEE